jgi:uncharacterized damage-inducible protein DinB
MTETHRINSQLERAYEGEAWHGPSLRELLDGVSAAQAASRPIPNAHSIWELVNHIILREAIKRIDDAKLDETATAMNYSNYFMLHGVVQHDLYHAGQIALLKKALG